ncbi:prolyl oligopeptidase family serine peptidase [Mesobacillus maritimus]|uniref:prolyl oligopeptidase family serine peptidase n=1 Tax=Mesobacillus maritimus TaxID=1643336 RepID=UPI00203EC356|nr:prolyl oligopeptidase family serine peptidase [Mesobacillus maritimus]MCM3672218.1 prolyl oligopeptidase family serine peptidase [Mesobacillus maritimus]
MRKYIMLFILILFITSAGALVVANPLTKRSSNNNADIRIIDRNKTNQPIQLEANIPYKKIEKKQLAIHLLIPKNTKKELPLIIFIKGSSWGKYQPQDTYQFIPQLVKLAERGYIVASIEHRTSHEAKFPAQLEDVRSAVVFLKEYAHKYNINPNAIGLWGTSSGAHLSALLATSCQSKEFVVKGKPSSDTCVQAVVDWYGPTDFLQMTKASQSYNAEHPKSAESLLIGGPILEHKELVKKANPITYVTPDAPPFLIMHGDKDERVPFHQSELLYNALKRKNADVTLYRVKGGGHGTTSFLSQEILETVYQFFDEHLKSK